jgi:hypothetical protein
VAALEAMAGAPADAQGGAQPGTTAAGAGASAAMISAYVAMARLTADRALAAGILRPADAERLLGVLGGRP